MLTIAVNSSGYQPLDSTVIPYAVDCMEIMGCAHQKLSVKIDANHIVDEFIEHFVNLLIWLAMAFVCQKAIRILSNSLFKSSFIMRACLFRKVCGKDKNF